MKISILQIFLFIFTCTIYAQQPQKINSLLVAIKHGKEDTFQVQNYNLLAASYTTKKPDSNLFYAHKALELSEKINYTTGKAEAYK